MTKYETKYISKLTAEDVNEIANMTDEDLAPLRALAEEADKAEVIYGTPSYARMDPSKNGSYVTVKHGNDDVAIAWTDWDASSGVVAFYVNDFVNDLRDYLQAAYDAGVPAGNAYSSLLTYITNSAPSGVKLSESSNGVLSNVLNTVLGNTDEIIETTETDDDTE